MANRPSLLTAIVCLLWFSCGPSLPTDYLTQTSAANAATQRKDHERAAEHWAQAARVAQTQTDRHEALFRQASSLKRDGQQAEYVALLRKLAESAGPRQQRATYDLATIALEGSPSDGGAAIVRALVRYPDSGLARGAVNRWLRAIALTDRVAALHALQARIHNPALSEQLLLLEARTAEQLGQVATALAIYKTLVVKYPYPKGTYWDEAYLRQAVLLRLQRRNREAIQVLDTMLSHREHTTLLGSYERRYAVAQLLKATLLLATDWRQAHDLLVSLSTSYPSSRLLDDALWSAALLASAHGDTELACDDARNLSLSRPESRYSSCLNLVCPGQHQQAKCRDYVATKRSSAQAVLALELDAVLRPVGSE